MTFDEWWEKTEKDEEIKNREVIYKNLAELLAHDAWKTAQKQQFVSDESAQPKWTLCKDGLPDNDSWVLVYMPETEDFEAMICTAYYTSGDWQSEWDTNQHPISAWMPLPEVPDNIDK